jgi:SagB-type dehydrogenase family enzyme
LVSFASEQSDANDTADTPDRAEVDPELVVWFANGEIMLTHARTRKQFRIDAQTLSVLAAAADPSGAERAQLEERYGTDSVRQAFEQLKTCELVGSGQRSTLAERWGDWGVSAWLLHHLSKQVRYPLDDEEIVAKAERVARTPPPPISRCRCAHNPYVELPHPRGNLGPPLSEALLARRTCRSFAEAPVTVQQLADLLFYTGGWLYREHPPYYGPVFKKCAPSPGARHTVEIYPILSRSEGVERGIYHYCVEHHRLVLISSGDPRRLADAIVSSQPCFAAAPAVFMLTCVPDRLMWKYKTPRAYRHAHLEAGHYCQNLVLMATALGLGVFQTGAISDIAAEDGLGIDGETEFVIYMAGVGHANDEPTEWPVEVSPRLSQLTATVPLSG